VIRRHSREKKGELYITMAGGLSPITPQAIACPLNENRSGKAQRFVIAVPPGPEVAEIQVASAVTKVSEHERFTGRPVHALWSMSAFEDHRTPGCGFFCRGSRSSRSKAMARLHGSG